MAELHLGEFRGVSGGDSLHGHVRYPKMEAVLTRGGILGALHNALWCRSRLVQPAKCVC